MSDVPCAKRARGTTDPNNLPPFDPEIDSDPCGKPVVTFANGVQMDSHLCCLPHLQMKLGLLAVQPPYTFVP